MLGTDMCSFIQLIDEQTANWSRDEAQDLMTNWLSTGEPFDARHFQQRRNGHRSDPGDEGRRRSTWNVIIGGVWTPPRTLCLRWQAANWTSPYSRMQRAKVPAQSMPPLSSRR